ncbi:hypothetical protein RUM44_002438 [Polyplax serrata]|uniref:Uncharacterized protein n=1 Tax=Polyplax serrata TaxID=468196 RepID=A0ABR1AET5_POLSC
MKEAAYAGKLQVKSLIISTNGTLSVRVGKEGEQWKDEEEGKRTVTAKRQKSSRSNVDVTKKESGQKNEGGEQVDENLESSRNFKLRDKKTEIGFRLFDSFDWEP